LLDLNLSASQISKELNLAKDTSHDVCAILRKGIVQKKEVPTLDGEVEIDEVYVIAGHKGNQEAVEKKGRKPRRNRLRGKRGRGTLEDEKAPILGMIKRGGEVVLKMLPNVQLSSESKLK